MNDLNEVRTPKELAELLFIRAKEKAKSQSPILIEQRDFHILEKILGKLGKKIGGGNQVEVYKWTRHNQDVAKIGLTREVMIEAICLSVISGERIVVSHFTEEDMVNSGNDRIQTLGKTLVVAPIIQGRNHDEMVAMLDRRKDESQIKELENRAIVSIAQAISRAEKHRISLNDIQFRQINHDEESSKWTDFSAARVGWYDEDLVSDIVQQLEAIAIKPPDKVRARKAKIELSRAIKNFNDALKQARVRDELMEFSQDSLFYVANSLRHGSSEMAEVAQNIDSASRVTLTNILSDLFKGEDKVANWSKIDQIVKDSLLAIFGYLQDGELLSEIVDHQKYAEIVTERLKAAFIFMDPIIDGLDFSQLETSILDSLNSLTSRIEAVKKITKTCSEKDLALSRSINNDWRTLKEKITTTSLDIQEKYVMKEAIDFFISLREELDVKLQVIAKLLQSGHVVFNQYLSVRNKIFSLQQSMSEFLENYLQNPNQEFDYGHWKEVTERLIDDIK